MESGIGVFSGCESEYIQMYIMSVTVIYLDILIMELLFLHFKSQMNCVENFFPD